MSNRTGFLRRLLLAALLLLAFGSSAAAAPPPELSSTSGLPCSGEGVYLYEDVDHTGACVKFTADDPELGDDGWHDRASSIKFVGFNYSNGRASATLYEHAYYSGASTTFSGNDPWLGDDAVGNDSADSIRIVQRPFCDMVSQIPQPECEALVAFYNSTGGPDWSNRTGWLASYLPCSWFGVTCSGGHVSELDFTWNNLRGQLPAQLAALIALERLVIEDTPLGGTIPPELGGLPNLRVLDLFMCGLGGSIPPELGNLRNLTNLSLTFNSLTGGIPPALGNLSELRVLLLSMNPLGGTIPTALGNLTSLEVLLLAQDQLTGNIPTGLGGLSSLSELNVSRNPGMSGPLPHSLTNLALMYFYFHETALCVPQNPSFESWLQTISDWQGSGITCSASTPTATLVHTPTPTRTRTPWPTPPGGPKRLVLPLLLRVR